MGREESKKIIIKFKVSKYRRKRTGMPFNPKLTPYWEKLFTDMFKGWK